MWMVATSLTIGLAIAPAPSVPSDDDAASDIDAPDAPQPPPTDADDPTPDPAAAEAAQHQLSAAQALYAAGDLQAAIAAATSALDNDPSLTAAYLTRAQLRVELAGPEAPTSPSDGVRWVDTLRAAADDIDAYLDLALLDETSRAELETERDRLRERADDWHPPRPERAPPPVLPASTPTPPRPTDDADHVGSSRHGWTGPTLVGFGIAATVAGAGLGSATLRIEQRCPQLCEAGWRVRPAFASTASLAAALGVVATGWGSARWIADRPPSPRARKIASGTLLGTTGVAAAAGASLLAIANVRWRGSLPSDDASLSTTQSLANAGIASLAVVPSLLTSGLVTALWQRRGARDRARVARVRRRPRRI